MREASRAKKRRKKKDEQLDGDEDDLIRGLEEECHMTKKLDDFGKVKQAERLRGVLEE